MTAGAAKVFDPRELYAEAEFACRVRVAVCAKQGCACGGVYLELLDCDEKVFAVAPFTASTAADVGHNLVSAGKAGAQ